jgi:hypothetical protein
MPVTGFAGSSGMDDGETRLWHRGISLIIAGGEEPGSFVYGFEIDGVAVA